MTLVLKRLPRLREYKPEEARLIKKPLKDRNDQNWHKTKTVSKLAIEQITKVKNLKDTPGTDGFRN